MSYKYRYTGDLPTVFITLRKDDATWMPSKGDTITLSDAVSHPLLELVVKETHESAKKDPVNDPATPEVTKSPATDDESKEI